MVSVMAPNTDNVFMLAIILDSNILLESPYLVREEWASLSAHRTQWGLYLVVPDVVRMETINCMRRDAEKEKRTFERARVAGLGVQDAVNILVQTIEERIEGYEEALDARFDELGIQIASAPPVPHLEIAKRASLRVAPYQAGEKDGYRDTLIWMTVLDVANQGDADEVWFVSNNVRDFGDVSYKGANTAGQITSPLHPDLLKDLNDRGLEGRVRYTRDLRALEQHLAALHGPLPDKEFQQLRALVDGTALRELLEYQLPISISARDAALDPTHAFGLLSRILSSELNWEFSDASGSGEDRWTSNYVVDIEAEIFRYSSTLPRENSKVTKSLRVSGTATFTRQGVPQQFEAARIEALPDDPDRGLWSVWEAAGFDTSDYLAVRDLQRSAVSEETLKKVRDLQGLSLSEETMSIARDLQRLSLSEETMKTIRDLQGLSLSEETKKTIRELQEFSVPEEFRKTFNAKIVDHDSSSVDPSTEPDDDTARRGEI